MRGRVGGARAAVIGALVVSSLLLAGCSEAPGSAPEPSVSASESATSSPTPTAVPLLPLAGTVLPTLRRFEFTAPPQGEAAALATLGVDLPYPEYSEGGLVRTVTQRGTPVGGVIILRWGQEVALNDGFQRDAVDSFAQKASTAGSVAGQPVWQVDDARGEGVGAVAWAQDLDLVLVWSQTGLGTTRAIARDFLGR